MIDRSSPGREAQSAAVTGAGRGVGRAIALALARRGHPVALQARSADGLKAVADEVRGLGGRAQVVPGDVTDPGAADRLLEAAEAMAPLEIAVAGAGQAASAPVLRTPPELMRSLLEVNLLGAFHLMQAAAGRMKGRGSGRIVVVGSTAAVRGFAYTGAYSASKHAVLGLARAAALELAPHGITVNVVCPGWIDTQMFRATLENISDKTGCTIEEARQKLEAKIPVGRVLEPDAVAELVTYVVASPHLTGQALVLDGGETL